jgi:4-phosphopantoate---beta-alanine ligase
MKIPRSHPRYESLARREQLVGAWKSGVVVPEGLIAHGRGEAWDYLIGEGTSAPALVAERAAAAFLLAAKRPVISVNGNVAALASREVVRLSKAIPATIEVNLFHRSQARVDRIVRALLRAGAKEVLGGRPNARIPRLDSKRAFVHREGIYGADVVLVPLEDGDRAEALVRMKKTVISIDLNPLSRTSQRASIPIVDELSRALLNIGKFVHELKAAPEEAARVRKAYLRKGNLAAVFSFLEWRMSRLRRAQAADTRARGTSRRRGQRPQRTRGAKGSR